MRGRIGSGYEGSSDIQTSSANQEIIASGRIYYKFSFYNVEQTKIKINGGNEIILQPQQGFSSSEVDCPIHSFVVVTPNVKFNYLAAF